MDYLWRLSIRDLSTNGLTRSMEGTHINARANMAKLIFFSLSAYKNNAGFGGEVGVKIIDIISVITLGAFEIYLDGSTFYELSG